MTADMIGPAELVARRRIAKTGYSEDPDDCIAYRSAVYAINYGDMMADCPLCGAAPARHEEDPADALLGPRLVV